MTFPRLGQDTDSYIDGWRSRIDSRLQSIVPPPAEPSQRVLAAMSYAVQGGHRWRPLFLIAAYEEIAGKDGLQVLDAACAIELIHCCTIILDDLPFVDNNTSLRRDKRPCHLVHGQAETVYASHLLYAKAERLSCANASILGVEEKLAQQQMTKLREDLVEAQVLETNLKNGAREVSEASIEYLYKLKGSLFVIAASLAATLGHFQAVQRERLIDFAGFLGTAYQVMDDILDVQGEPSAMGKPVHMDLDKVNLVSQIGAERSKEFLQGLLLQADDVLKTISEYTPVIHELLHRVALPR